jgi:hypothetical protein
MSDDDNFDRLISQLSDLEDQEALPFMPDRTGGNALLEGMPAALLARDMEDGRILWLNRACSDLLGVDPEGIVGKTTGGAGVDLILDRGDPHLMIPGDPRRATVIDIDGAKIGCMVFRRSMELGYRKVELDLIIESHKLGEQEMECGVRKRLLDKAMAASGSGYIIAELLQLPPSDDGSDLPEDLLVLDWGGSIPESLEEDLGKGVSISSSVPTLSDAGLVQAASRAESQHETQTVDIPDAGRAEVSLDPPATAVVFLRGGDREGAGENIIVAGTGAAAPEVPAPPEEESAPEEEPPQEVRSSLHRSTTKPAVMYLGFDDETLESGEKMLGLLGFSPVPVHAGEADEDQIRSLSGSVKSVVADVGSRDTERAFELLSVVEEESGSVVIIADEKILFELKGRGLSPRGWVARPCGINDLAMALSDI